MVSNASATPPPPVNFSQDALQQLAGAVFDLLKDLLGNTMQGMAQQQQQQHQRQQEQFLQGAAQQIQQQGQQQQQQQQEQQQQQFL